MNAGSVKITLVQRQLREDWNNREYAQVVSDNIRHIADFLCNFELSCRSRIATLSDKVSLLERKVEFLEARVSMIRTAATTIREVVPIVSANEAQSRANVLAVYKEMLTIDCYNTSHLMMSKVLRILPLTRLFSNIRSIDRVITSPTRKFVSFNTSVIVLADEFGMGYAALRFSGSFKKQYTSNAHLTDFRIIDRKIAECRQAILACKRIGITHTIYETCYSSAKRRFCISSNRLQSQQSSIDGSDVKAFGKLSPDWTKEYGPFKALYSMNRLRLPLIIDTIGRKTEQGHDSLLGLRIADIGCGGGILTFPLARLGADVEAVDASPDVIASVEEAENCFRQENRGSGKVVFKCSSVEDFAANNAGMFDAVVASEIIEHVADVELFVESCVQLVRKNGALFLQPLIKLLRRVLGIVPPGIHNWSKFIEPRFLRMILEENDCSVRLMHGIIYNPFTNHWSWSRNMSVNYALVAIKE
ncbi:Ubiquinone biosynthesis O-methyltransferase, mitochondrial [Dirofilaria immitis]|nr:Ubiquinone biosynthesis O-methyltransferase, mitochondrial [Dirofilaria immitis]